MSDAKRVYMVVGELVGEDDKHLGVCVGRDDFNAEEA